MAIVKKVKKKLIDISKKNLTFRKFLRNTRTNVLKIKYKKYYKKYKVDDKVILFEAFGGRNYTCSPKAIYEKLVTLKEFQDYKMIWAFIDPNIHEVLEFKNLEIVKSKSKDYYKYCSIAKYWIVNSIMPEEIIKKKSQI